jgi:hypothetical protein
MVLTACGKQFALEPATFVPSKSSVKAYAKTLVKWTQPTWREGIEEVEVLVAIRQLKLTSSPGFPYRQFYTTNKQVIDNELDSIIKLAVARVCLMRTRDLSGFTTEALVLMGARDPLSPIIKNEPHKSSKVITGKYRVVQCLSIVDQIVERVIFGQFPGTCINSYPNLNMLAGIGFTDKMNQELGEVYTAMCDKHPKYTPVTTDVITWDSRVSVPMVGGFVDTVFKSCSNPSAFLRQSLDNWCHVSVKTAYIVPSGVVFVKNVDGQTISGSTETTELNCVARGLAAMAVKSIDHRNNGDDCIEMTLLDKTAIIAAYAKIGIPVREVEVQGRESFTFCSHNYRLQNGRWTATLESWPKAAYKLFSTKKGDRELLAAFLYEVRHDKSTSDRVKATYAKVYGELE